MGPWTHRDRPDVTGQMVSVESGRERERALAMGSGDAAQAKKDNYSLLRKSWTAPMLLSSREEAATDGGWGFVTDVVAVVVVVC